MKLYIVSLHSAGDLEKHSYVLGAFDTKDKAIHAGREEVECRGGGFSPNGNKYEFRITEAKLNEYDEFDNFPSYFPDLKEK